MPSFLIKPMFCAGLFLIFLSSAEANPPILANDPKRPVAQISADLGISAEQFIACFNQVHPATQGSKPTSEKVHANKHVLLQCLQTANPNITNQQLDTVMDRYRPGGHAAQEPERDAPYSN